MSDPATAPAPNPAEWRSLPSTATAPAPNPAEWRSLPSMSEARSGPGGVMANDHQFLLLGGYRIKTCEYYDTRTKIWKYLPIDLPFKLAGMRVARIGNRIFVMGGTGLNDKSRSRLVSIDVSGGDLSKLSGRNWLTLAPMKEKRSSFACVAHGKYLYVFGGHSARNALDTAERYDIGTDQWTSLPNLPDGKRDYCAAGVVENKIYVVGGRGKVNTLVFDTTTQNWELPETSVDPGDDEDATIRFSNVPDRNSPKANTTMVVVVDRFVVAISDSNIEILDTEHNVWRFAQTPMPDTVLYPKAGFAKSTNEIIVADPKKKHANAIEFYNGILPPAFRIKERGQKVAGDIARGDDRLGVQTIAEVLAESLVFKDTAPPLVLGVLGRWGRGKSYFFNLMLDHLVGIQKREADTFVRDTFAGHIYVIEFDAWTFSKGDVWSSLMIQILKSLNEQLEFEGSVDNQDLIDGKVSTIQVFRDLSTDDIEYFKAHPNKKEMLKQFKKNGDKASKSLLRAINENYKYDQNELEVVKRKIEKKQAELVVQEMKGRVGNRGKKFLKNAFDKAFDETSPLLGDNSKDKILEQDKQRADIIKDIDNIWRSGHKIFEFSNIPPFAFVCFAFFAVTATILMFTFEDKISSFVSGLISLLIPYISGVSAGMKQIRPFLTKLEKVVTDDLDTKFDGEHSNNKVLKELREHEAEINNRILVLEGCSLRQTIASKIDPSEYENNLGIVHKVQQDLKLLSDGMLNPNNLRKEDIFPRGVPRIVLFVDDLDRCDETTVVDVIEALQLLVKTNLFVAVLAIDPRYVTLSLEQHYKGILRPCSPPTGMDFLEKIIQIPFRLPGVQHDNVDDFIENEIDVEEEPKTVSDATVEEPDSDDTSTATPKENRDDPAATASDKDEDAANPNDIQDPEDPPIPKNKILFTIKEKKMMSDIFKLVRVGPRCLRRIVNVFKLLKVIWNRDSKGRFPEEEDLKNATLLVMLLAANESTRNVTYTIFDWMEVGTVMYHHTIQDKDGEWLPGDKNNLAALFKIELQKRDKSYKNPTGSKKGTLMWYIEKYLSRYEWESADEWNEVSSKFLLARCFSFFRLVTAEMETRQQASETYSRSESKDTPFYGKTDNKTEDEPRSKPEYFHEFYGKTEDEPSSRSKSESRDGSFS